MVGAGRGRQRCLGRAGDGRDHGGTGPACELYGRVTHRTRTAGDQHNLAGKGARMQPLGSVLRHCQGAVRGHGRYTEAGSDIKARACRKAHHPGRGQVGVLLRGARRPLVAGEIHPDPITRRKGVDTLPDCVDNARTVLVRSYLRERRRCAITRAKAGLPVGGVNT
jgi:hypothetical protein